jgi:hypothetical protein
VQVALDPAPCLVGGLDDPQARGLELLDARGLGLALQPQLLARAALRDVEDDPVEPLAPVAIDRLDAPLEHPADAAVGVDDAVLERERPARGGRRADLPVDRLAVVGMGHRYERALRRVDEVGGRVARDALDLVADPLHLPDVVIMQR